MRGRSERKAGLRTGHASVSREKLASMLESLEVRFLST